jgi:ATP-dependent Clp protease ATP-binding subunit ClpB
MHTLVGAGKADGAMDASNLLKPALARGELHCVGLDPAQDRHRVLDGRLRHEDRLEAAGEGGVLLDVLAVLVQDAALVAAATLSNRYITDRFLPDKAIDLVDEAAPSSFSSRVRRSREAASGSFFSASPSIFSRTISRSMYAAELKKKLDEARNELAAAQRQGQYQRAGELAYGLIPG